MIAAATPTRSGPGQAVVRTLPEQIADDLGGKIATGALQPGDRLLEVDISKRYGVSRAPVREAIRLLARRGFVDFYPRRGAFVIEFTIEAVRDIFNIVGALNGLAARYFCEHASDGEISELREITQRLDTLADDPACEPQTFVAASHQMNQYYVSHCGSSSISNLLHHHTSETAWGTLWRQTSRDFQTQARRREAADLYGERQRAFEARDGLKADTLCRELTDLARDEAVKTLKALREHEAERRKAKA